MRPVFLWVITPQVSVMGCLHDLANVQQTSSKCIQNTRANAGRLLDRVNTLLLAYISLQQGRKLWASVLEVSLLLVYQRGTVCCRS